MGRRDHRRRTGPRAPRPRLLAVTYRDGSAAVFEVPAVIRRAPPRGGCSLGCAAPVAREGLCARCASVLDDVRAEGAAARIARARAEAPRGTTLPLVEDV